MKVTRYVMIDPPSGWKYGFPKRLDQSLYANEGFTLTQWILDQGYPESELDKNGELYWIRSWVAEPPVESKSKKSIEKIAKKYQKILQKLASK